MADIEKRKANGQFAKGNAGRPKGAVNKLTKELRAELKDLVFSELEYLSEILPKSPPHIRLEVLLKLIPYVIPKPKPVEAHEGEPWQGVEFEW